MSNRWSKPQSEISTIACCSRRSHAVLYYRFQFSTIACCFRLSFVLKFSTVNYRSRLSLVILNYRLQFSIHLCPVWLAIQGCTGLARSGVQLLAEGPRVPFFTTGPGWVLTCKIPTLENLLSPIYRFYYM